MRLIVGLGNPGPAYRGTRHNLGFDAIDQLAGLLGLVFNREKYQGLIAEGRAGGGKVLLLKPLVYMNKSGVCVAQAARNNADTPEDVLILYDEVDLPLGRLRLRKGGSAGTHNGMKSVLASLGTQNVPRARLGVGPNPPGVDLADYVLGKFRPDEQAVAKDLAERGARAALACIEHGLDKAMNEFNQEKPAPE